MVVGNPCGQEGRAHYSHDQESYAAAATAVMSDVTLLDG
jgi:hypothetical protein